MIFCRAVVVKKLRGRDAQIPAFWFGRETTNVRHLIVPRRYYKPSKFEKRLEEIYLGGCVLPRIILISVALALGLLYAIYYEGSLIIRYLISLFK